MLWVVQQSSLSASCVLLCEGRHSQRAPDNVCGAETTADRRLLDEVCNLVLIVNELQEGGRGRRGGERGVAQ